MYLQYKTTVLTAHGIHFSLFYDTFVIFYSFPVGMERLAPFIKDFKINYLKNIK